MRLLIITQKVDKNDSVLGFFHRWIEEFAKRCESIVVICLQKGEYNLPENVRVLSLGKEEGGSRASRTLRYIARFYRYIWRERKNYDSVFVHMNPEYIVMGGFVWRLLGKKITLWYTHKSVNLKLQVAEFFSNSILSASKESFRLPSKKLQIVGHGIDTDLFLPDTHAVRENIILTVGRISRTKQLIEMLDILDHYPEFILTVIGEPITAEDTVYEKKLIREISARNLSERVMFLGSLPQAELPKWYNKARVFINLSKTGSLDKAVLEALSMDTPVYTTNEAFLNTSFPVFQTMKEVLEFKGNTRDYIIKNHSLERLIARIVKAL